MYYIQYLSYLLYFSIDDLRIKLNDDDDDLGNKLSAEYDIENKLNDDGDLRST